MKNPKTSKQMGVMQESMLKMHEQMYKINGCEESAAERRKA